MIETQKADPLLTECRAMADRARIASRGLAIAPGSAKDGWLRRSAQAIRARASEILEANARDVAAGPGLGLNSAAIDRLTLDPKRLEKIAASLEEVAALPDPVGEVIASSRRPNGLEVSQLRVPLGVVFMIFESRPNVTVDASAICVKSGNAAILRGGKEASEFRIWPCTESSPTNWPRAACRATPCNWSPRRIARLSAICSGCPTGSTWPSPGGAKA